MSKPKRLFSCWKVVQYKKRCSELELLTEQQRNDIDRFRLTVRIQINEYLLIFLVSYRQQIIHHQRLFVKMKMRQLLHLKEKDKSK